MSLRNIAIPGGQRWRCRVAADRSAPAARSRRMGYERLLSALNRSSASFTSARTDVPAASFSWISR
jgi:hypothetical protein